MYKREVVSFNNNKTNCYVTKLSSAGMFTRPQQKKHYKLPIDISGIEYKDVVRVDGLPFLSKPTIKNPKYKALIENDGYKAVHLPTGYWVLRKEG